MECPVSMTLLTLGPPNHSIQVTFSALVWAPVMWQPFEVHGVMPPSVCSRTTDVVSLNYVRVLAVVMLSIHIAQ